jgi:hypothetical protein
MTNMTEEMTLEVVKDTTNALPKKSELISRHRELMAKNEQLLSEMQMREYEVDFKSKKIFDKLAKFLEKDSEWTHTTAAGLIMLYHNLREEKVKTTAKDWNNQIALRAANVSILWQMMTRMTGKGFYEARDFVELMATIGEPISKAVQRVHADNQEIRDNHAELAKLDGFLDGGQYENDTVEEKANLHEVADEVDPLV